MISKSKAEDLLHPELHVMLYDSDAQLGGVINFEDDFLGEVRIPLLDDVGEVTSTLDMLHEYPLTGELAEAEHSTVTLAWEYVDTVVAPGKNPNFVEYRVTAITLNDSYVGAGTQQPVYAMFVGDLGATPLLCLQDRTEQVLVSSKATHWVFE